MNILIWHVHGSWTTAFVQGRHRYLVPVVRGRGPDGRGRARTWSWPPSVIECTPEQLRDEQVDVVVLQRRRDAQLLERWTGRRAGRDVPAVWLEHSSPQGRIAQMRHPAADRRELIVVHVTHTNRLFWDCGSTPTAVIEHGIVDPGFLYSGDLERVAVVINEPRRRGRVVGADLLPYFAAAAPIDLYGMRATECAGELVEPHDDVPQGALHRQLGMRRAYLHTSRWTSLGLSLIEAMHIGMPVVALATTEAPAAVPPEAGVVSNDVELLRATIRHWVSEPEEAKARGKAARAWALERYGLERFIDHWDRLLEGVIA
jgi:hypothetical protein